MSLQELRSDERSRRALELIAELDRVSEVREAAALLSVARAADDSFSYESLLATLCRQQACCIDAARGLSREYRHLVRVMGHHRHGAGRSSL